MSDSDWWPIGEFHFTRKQVVWLLPYLELVREGHWVPEDKETGYVGGSGRKPTRAPFTAACEVAAELDIRLRKVYQEAPGDHHLCIERFQHNADMGYLARVLGIDVVDAYRRSNRALWYCCGRRQRRVSYKEFTEFACGKRLQDFSKFGGL